MKRIVPRALATEPLYGAQHRKKGSLMTKLLDTAVRIDNRFKHAVAMILAIGSMGWGLSLILMPEELTSVRGFSMALEWASGPVWGSAFIILGLIQFAAAFSAFRMVVWPAAALTVLYSAMSIAIVLGASTRQPVPPAIWLYITMALLSGLLAQSTLLFGAPKK